jgi:ribosomal-protein-alanine N-acetyltransferase
MVIDLYDPFPVLETPRLALRRLGARDREALFGMSSDPETMRYRGAHPWTSLEQADELLARIEALHTERRGIEWGVTRRGDDEVVGKVNHHRWVREHFRSEVGFMIRRDLWRQGLATEAMTAVLALGFARMGLHSVEAQLDP